MPKELVCTAPMKLEWRTYEEPKLKAGEVRVRSMFSAAKHGTEMSYFKGYGNARGSWNADLGLFESSRPADPYPAPLGNMFVGPIVEIGPGVDILQPGDEVFAHGGFRETHVVEAGQCRNLKPGFSWKSAVCIDPAEFALGAIRDGHIRMGDRVAVFGLGAIGLVTVQIAMLAGASLIIGVDPLQKRREVARTLGAGICLDPLRCDAGMEIKKSTGNRGADVCVDFSGNRQALQQAIRGVAYGGSVVYGAYPGPFDAGLDLGAEAHINAVNLVFSRACSEPNRDHPSWTTERIRDTCYQLIMEGKINGEQIVTPVVPFDELIDVYPKIATDPGSMIKLGVRHY